MNFRLSLTDATKPKRTWKYSSLEEAFSRVPEGTTSLDLSCNSLGQETHYEFHEIFSWILASVSLLDVSRNFSYDQAINPLVHMVLAVPEHIPSLSLSQNNLGFRTGQELAELCAAIRSHGYIKWLDLSENYLYKHTVDDLVNALAELPAGMTVILRDNALFKSASKYFDDPLKKYRCLDELRSKLNQANPDITLDLSNNLGDLDVPRAIAPLACFAKKPANERKDSVPTDVLVHALSFLLPKNKSEDKHVSRLEKKFTNALSLVSERESLNDITPVGFVPGSYVGHK